MIEDFEATAQSANRTVHAITGGKPSPSPELMEAAVRSWFRERVERPDFDGTADPGQEPFTSIEAQRADLQRLATSLGAETPVTTAWIAQDMIEQNGWSVEAGSNTFRRLSRLVARGQLAALGRQRQDLALLPRRTDDEMFSAENFRLDEERAKARPAAHVSIRSLFAKYLAERKPAAATEKAWSRFIAAWVEFIGHDDAAAITPDDVLRWKDHLASEPIAAGQCRSAKTVNETYLAALRTVLGWGVSNRLLSANAASGIRVYGPRRQRTRDASFSDGEATAILRASLRSPPIGVSSQRALAIRWVPWICAYTGARVNEVTQLRADDIYQEEGVWVIRITPEAGSTKNHRYRAVALHNHILEQGFLEAVSNLRGPLFYDPAQYRGGKKGNPQSKKCGEFLARWVRTEAKVTDPRVQPNHGWRHRFKTVARRVRMDAEVCEYIQGHAGRTEGSKYGEQPPSVTAREINLIPRYQL
ncbi:hypothetical protein [Sphingomonas changbaiensis]|uniref:hypothetical protein n=1 Tax=Sphingomonas changbaiensis TaxID=529705 RepID=UPI00147039F2|nr:hypothetical protein [Sphingomonas changbaiensis]